LQSYEGTVFLVSHDRRFLDHVVTSTLVAEGDGLWREYEGSVEDWLTQSARSRAIQETSKTGASQDRNTLAVAQKDHKPRPAPAARPAKLSYKEQRELDGLPARIEALEAEQAALRAELADGSLYSRDPQRAAALHARDAAIEDELMAALERWEALSAR
jgi:ATP-binding cassette subfamily F protein uup